MTQSLYAIIAGREVPVLSARLTWTQGQVNTAEISILARYIDSLNITFSDWSLVRNGNVVMSGIVLDEPGLDLNKDRDSVYRISAVDELGRLTCKRAVSDAHFQDVDLPTMINFLLAGVTGYVLGDTSTLINPAAKTTIDLRAKETLFAQIAEAVKQFPRTFLRYGGMSGTNHLLDVGYFGVENYVLGQHDNLADLKKQRNTKRAYKYVEAYGGRSRSTRPTLGDAINATLSPTIALRTQSDPNYATYPIVQIGGKYLVDNTEVSAGCEVTKEFSINKTENSEAPTNEEKAEAAFAVWQKTVRFLQENRSYETYTGTGYYVEPPNISDSVFVQAQVYEPAYDELLHQTELVPVFVIHKPYRITKITADFTESAADWRDDACGNTETLDAYDLEMTDNDYAELVDDDAALYERLERPDIADEDEESALTLKRVDIVTVEHQSSTPSDAACLPTVAKRFVFTLPAVPPPSGATQLLGSVVAVSPVGAIVNITQYAAYPNTPLIACVQDGTLGGWGTNDVSVTARYDWI